MTEALYIRLAGPLQSWAGPANHWQFCSNGTTTYSFGACGIVGGCLRLRPGRIPRMAHPAAFPNPGRTIVGPWLMIFTPSIRGTRKRNSDPGYFSPWGSGQQKSCLIARLMGRASPLSRNEPISLMVNSLCRIKAGSREHQELLAEKLRQPHFVTYLGRKAFAPSFPFYLGVGPDDTLARIPTVGGEEPKKILRFYALDDYGYTTTTVPVVKES